MQNVNQSSLFVKRYFLRNYNTLYCNYIQVIYASRRYNHHNDNWYSIGIIAVYYGIICRFERRIIGLIADINPRIAENLLFPVVSLSNGWHIMFRRRYFILWGGCQPSLHVNTPSDGHGTMSDTRHARKIAILDVLKHGDTPFSSARIAEISFRR